MHEAQIQMFEAGEALRNPSFMKGDAPFAPSRLVLWTHDEILDVLQGRVAEISRFMSVQGGIGFGHPLKRIKKVKALA